MTWRSLYVITIVLVFSSLIEEAISEEEGCYIQVQATDEIQTIFPAAPTFTSYCEVVIEVEEGFVLEVIVNIEEQTLFHYQFTFSEDFGFYGNVNDVTTEYFLYAMSNTRISYNEIFGSLVPISTAFGLTVTYKRRQFSCGEEINYSSETYGIISSPPQETNETDCLWTFNKRTSLPVQINFMALNIMGENDYLDIYTANTFVERLSGSSTLPKHYLLAGTVVYLVYHSETTGLDSSFSAEYSADIPCDQSFQNTLSPATTAITFLDVVAPGTTTYSLECKLNFTAIADGIQEIAIELPASGLFNARVQSGIDNFFHFPSQLQRFVAISSDENICIMYDQQILNLIYVGSQEISGFAMTYRQYQENCGTNSAANFSIQTIASPESTTGSECTWNIAPMINENSEFHFLVQSLLPTWITISHLEINNEGDYLEILDNSTSRGHFTSSLSEPVQVSSDVINLGIRNMVIRFSSKPSLTPSTFSIDYQARQCGFAFVDQQISSFAIPGSSSYSFNIDQCTYVIQSINGETIILILTSGSEYEGGEGPFPGERFPLRRRRQIDYFPNPSTIEVYDGSTLVKTLDSSVGISFIVGLEDKMTIQYYSNGYYSYYGFSSLYQAKAVLSDITCGGEYVATTSSQSISTPNFLDGELGQAFVCVWNIVASQGHRIVLSFVESASTGRHLLQVFDGTTIIHQYTLYPTNPETTTVILKSTTSSLRIEYIQYFQYSDSGFSATFLQEIDVCSPNPCQYGGTCIIAGSDSFECLCPSGYMGATCFVTPCSLNPCLNGGVCIPTIDGYQCACTSGFSGNNCFDDVNECLNGNPCAANAKCTDIAAGFECDCNEGFRGDGKVQCYKIILLPYGLGEGDILLPVSDNAVSSAIRFNFAIPFGTKSFFSIRVSSNGLLILGTGFYFFNHLFAPSSDNFPGNIALIAPFWDNFHPSPLNGGVVYYQLYSYLDTTQSSIFEEVTRRVNLKFNVSDFQPTIIFKATWHEVVMFQESYPGHRNFPSTFQAILVSDGCSTYLMFLYKEDAMLWRTGLRGVDNALIGYTDGAGTTHVEASGYYTPDQRVQSGGGVSKGQYFYDTTPVMVPETEARCGCLRWYMDDKASSWSPPNEPCPCSSFQASLDSSFALSVDNVLPNSFTVDEWTYDWVPSASCYQPISGVGPRCCYWGGRLVDTSPFGGIVAVGPLAIGPLASRYERYQIPLQLNDDTIATRDAALLQSQYNAALEEDLIPRRQCCIDSNSYGYCSLYRERRPSAFCRGYVSFVPSFLWGDPHLTTLDEAQYTFNGLGEFFMIYAPGSFTLQGRTAKIPKEDGSLSDATGFVAFAAQDNSEPSGLVIFKVDESSSDGVIVTVDDTIQVGMDEGDPLVNGIQILDIVNGFKAIFPSDQSISVTASNSILSVQFTGDPSVLQNVSKGLLGHWNGNKQDDFELRDETVLNYNSLIVTDNTDILGDEYLSERKLYPFGLSWQISKEESLFSYTDEEPYEFFNPDNVMEPPFLEDLVNDQRGSLLFQGYVEGCTTDGTISTSCLYDTLATNRTELGQETLNSQMAARESTIINDNTPPTVEAVEDELQFVNGFFRIKFDEPAFLRLTGNDVDGDNVTFGLSMNSSLSVSLIGLGEDTVFWEGGTITSTTTQLIVTASDGISESTAVIPVLYCPCQNNGSCLFDTTVDGSDSFQVVACSCTDAWSGDDCTEDRDDCALGACYPGVSCTDVPAPEVGVICGRCPLGTEGDGRTCITIDLCETANCSQGCIPRLGGYDCVCDEGYRINNEDNSSCDDIVECSEGTPCAFDFNSECENTDGSYSCICINGTMRVEGGGLCQNIDECLDDNDNECDTLSTTCVDLPTTYQCVCLPGFDKSSFEDSQAPCLDMDECESGDNTCIEETENCTNTQGSFFCICKDGFQKNPSNGMCENIVECLPVDPCPTNFTCVDNFGSYTCILGESPPLITCNEAPIIRLDTAVLNELDVGFNDMVVISRDRLDSAMNLSPKCRTSFNDPVTFEIELLDCDPIIWQDDYYIYVTYVIRNQPYRNPQSVIQRFEDHCLNLTCKFDKKDNVSMGPLLPEIKKNVAGYESERAEFELEMCFFTNDTFDEKIEEDYYKVMVYDDVFVKINLIDIEEWDRNFILQIKRCYASRDYKGNELYYELISDGCPADDYLQIITNFEAKYGTFKFQSFVWTGISDDNQKIYVHCDVVICHNDTGSSCEQTESCDGSQKRRRDLKDTEEMKSITSNVLIVIPKEKNLCQIENGGCSDECRIDGEVARCRCFDDRVLSEDNKTCLDFEDSINAKLIKEKKSSQLEKLQLLVIAFLLLIIVFFALYLICFQMSRSKRML